MTNSNYLGAATKIVEFFSKPETITHLVNVVIILLAMFVVNVILKVASKKTIKKVDKWDEDESSREKRAITLISVLRHTISTFVWGIGALMIFREIGLNIAPLLTGAGILGLAIGFGAQSIVKDFFTGFFILLENQFRVGDVVTICGITGTVQEINLRITKLRDASGVFHFVPNGEIRSVSNMSFLWSKAVVKVGVAYGSDVTEVTNILNSIADDLMKDKKYKDFILEKPSVLGINSFDDSSLSFKMIIKTKSNEQWGIARATRIKIKEAFDKAGIEIPLPQRVIINK